MDTNRKEAYEEMLNNMCHKGTQIKTKWDATTYLLELLKSKTQTALNAAKDAEQQELSFIRWECEMEQPREDKTKHTFTRDPITLLVAYPHMCWKLIYVHKNLYVNIYSSFFHQCPNLEALKIVVHRTN